MHPTRPFTAAVIAAAVLLSPFWSEAARPKRVSLPVLLAGMYREAGALEADGDLDGAEEKFIQILNLARHDRYRTESHWLDYMKSLRTLFGFYTRRGDFREAAWYYRLYSGELHRDPEAEEMFLLLVLGAVRPLDRYREEHRFEKAEETLLYLKDFLEDDLAFSSAAFELIYRNLTDLYLEMDRKEKARECAERLEEIRRRRTFVPR